MLARQVMSDDYVASSAFRGRDRADPTPAAIPPSTPSTHCQPRSCFRLCVALSEGGFSSVGDLDPLRIMRGFGVVVVVPVPPLVGRCLRVALRRVLPLLLASQRGDVEVVPG